MPTPESLARSVVEAADWHARVRDTDGRVFTAATISEMLEVEPFPGLGGLVDVLAWSSDPKSPD